MEFEAAETQAIRADCHALENLESNNINGFREKNVPVLDLDDLWIVLAQNGFLKRDITIRRST